MRGAAGCLLSDPQSNRMLSRRRPAWRRDGPARQAPCRRTSFADDDVVDDLLHVRCLTGELIRNFRLSASSSSFTGWRRSLASWAWSRGEDALKLVMSSSGVGVESVYAAHLAAGWPHACACPEETRAHSREPWSSKLYRRRRCYRPARYGLSAGHQQQPPAAPPRRAPAAAPDGWDGPATLARLN